MRVLPLLLLAILAGCAAVPELAQEPTDWRMSSFVVGTERFCGDCHYGMERFWLTEWEEGNATWNLTVRPAYPEVPLWSVQAALGNASADSPHALTEILLEEMRNDWTDAWTVEVPGNGTALFVRVHASPPGTPEHAARHGAQMRENTFPTTLVATAPDGTVHEAVGPDMDLRSLVVPAMEGTWTIHAAVDTDEAVTGVMTIEALHGAVAHAPDAWTFEVPAVDGKPEPVLLRVRPFHEHDAYENTDWDAYDMSPFLEVFSPTAAPEPVSGWGDLDAYWDADERVLQQRSGQFVAAYVDEEGHNDPGVGSSYPHFALPPEPVPPGTDHLRLELTWTPPVDAPVGVRYSPHGSPYFYDADGTLGAGAATFQIPVRPDQWEAPDQDLPHLPGPISHWDFGPFLGGDVRVGALDYAFRIVAVRAP